MKTTLNIDDHVMAEVKCEAARQGRMISELVQTALRLFLHPQTTPRSLPSFCSGGPSIDIASEHVFYCI